MFNAKSPAGVHDAIPATNGRAFSAHANAGDSNCSIINEWLVMRGDLESEGDILVKGKVHGNIQCKMLIIDAEAIIEGAIFADEVVVRGTTRGIIKAQRVRLEKTANVDSEIYQGTFSAEEGARIKGALRGFDDYATSAKEPLRQSRKLTRTISRVALPSTTFSIKPARRSTATSPSLNKFQSLCVQTGGGIISRRRFAYLSSLFRLARDFGELLHQRAHTFQPLFRQIPIGAINQLLIRLHLQRAA